MTKIIVDPDELWENLNKSFGITLGGRAPKWHWLGALKATEHTIYEEQPQDNLNEDEKRLIGEAVNYLLGAELVEENGWSKEDVNTLHSLCMKFYGEDYN